MFHKLFCNIEGNLYHLHAAQSMQDLMGKHLSSMQAVTAKLMGEHAEEMACLEEKLRTAERLINQALEAQPEPEPEPEPEPDVRRPWSSRDPRKPPPRPGQRHRRIAPALRCFRPSASCAC